MKKASTWRLSRAAQNRSISASVRIRDRRTGRARATGRLPPKLLARLATAASLLLEIDSGDGQLRRYEPWKADLDTLKQFVAQISPDAP